MTAGCEPPPDAVRPHSTVLSVNVDAGYPQLSFVPEADSTMIPGLQAAASAGAAALQLDPTAPPVAVQSVPLQHRLGPDEGCGVHVRPGAQPPAESQRHPCVPTMHVCGTAAPPEDAEELLGEVVPDDVEPPASISTRTGPVLPDCCAELLPADCELVKLEPFDGDAPHADAANPANPAPQINPRTLRRKTTIMENPLD